MMTGRNCATNGNRFEQVPALSSSTKEVARLNNTTHKGGTGYIYMNKGQMHQHLFDSTQSKRHSQRCKTKNRQEAGTLVDI